MERDPGDGRDPPNFFLLVHNSTPVPVLLYRHHGTTGQPYARGATDDDNALAYLNRTLTVRVPAGETVSMTVRAPGEGEWLVLRIRWRRLSGGHLFQVVPLFLILTPAQVRAVREMQTSVETVG